MPPRAPNGLPPVAVRQTDRRSRHWLVALLILAAAAWSSPAAADDAEQAREEFRLGKADYLEGRYEEAISHYQRAMQLKPSSKLHYNIGLAQEKLGQPAKALASYRAYLAAEPDAPNAAEVKGRIAALASAPAPRPPAVILPRVMPPQRQPGEREQAPGVSGTGQPPGPPVTVSFSSDPPWAQLSVNGQVLGTTPINLLMVAGGSYQVQVTQRGFLPTTTTVVAREGEVVPLKLQRSAEGRLRAMTRPEWFGLEPLIGGLSGNFAIGLRLTVAALRWHYAFWSIGQFNGLLGPNGAVDVGTRLGFPLYFGRDGQHQLRFGLGASLGIVGELPGSTALPTQWGLILSPCIDYRYQTARRFIVGVGLCYAGMPARNIRDGDRPNAVLLTVPMGWASFE